MYTGPEKIIKTIWLVLPILFFIKLKTMVYQKSSKAVMDIQMVITKETLFVKVNLWFLKKPKKSGIFNVGTGCAVSFNQLCQEIINYVGHGSISYIPFPEHLKKHYQSYTQADISSLRSAGYDNDFKDIKAGMKIYCKNLSA